MDVRQIQGIPGRTDVQVTAAGIAILVVVSLTYWGFRTPYSEYLPVLHLARNPAAFASDPILANSVYLKASIYYSLVRKLELPVENDVFGLVLHFVLNGGILFLLFHQARRSFGLADAPSAAAFVLVACFFYSKFVLGAQAQPIHFHTPTPTGLAHLTGMAALLFALGSRWAVAAVLATLCVALSPKGNVLLVPALALGVLADRSVPKRAYAYIMLPVAFIVYRALDPAISGVSHEDAVRMTFLLMAREQSDGLFTDQPLLANALLAATFIIFPFLVRAFADRRLRILAWSLFAVTLPAVVIIALYPLVYERFPVPALVMLAFPQGTKYFLFVFSAMAVARILNEPRFEWHEKLAALIAFIILKPFPLQAAAAATVAIGGIAVPRLGAKLVGGTSGFQKLARRVDIVPLPVALAVLLTGFVLFRSGTTYVGPSWIDVTAFRHTGNWTSSVWAKEDAWQAWESLGRRNKDFPLLAVYEAVPVATPVHAPRKYETHPYAYTTSGKSQFAPLPAHAYLDLDLWMEAQRRWEIRETILDRLNQGLPVDDTWIGTVRIRKEQVPLAINDTLTGFLEKRGARMLVPSALASLFPAGAKREDVGTHVLISFDHPGTR